ncbi:hypothetical protein CXB51_005474 [Gossypium anomalum]|uniref:Integrase zinc-binding domain-containing protein n=1 Tax=Gossypium anomalum TaxID=47600 RepID=A0A8J5ZCB7_9ROSI|nr:hypothetical protein CXB51_005474 [Gossypium anomalum]
MERIVRYSLCFSQVLFLSYNQYLFELPSLVGVHLGFVDYVMVGAPLMVTWLNWEKLGYFGGMRTAAKVLQSGFYWPTLFKYAHNFVNQCDRCQRTNSISQCNQMLQQPIIEVESFGNLYILVAANYVSKWVDVTPQTRPRRYGQICDVT